MKAGGDDIAQTCSTTLNVDDVGLSICFRCASGFEAMPTRMHFYSYCSHIPIGLLECAFMDVGQ